MVTAAQEPDNDKKWAPFPERLEDASRFVIDIRVADNAKVEMDGKNGLSEFNDSRSVYAKKYETRNGIFLSIRGSYTQQIDDEATINAW